MSTEAPNPQATKQREFMSLLPLTLAIAGLPAAEHGKYHNEGQMELRMNNLRAAYKYARQLVVEMSQ